MVETRILVVEDDLRLNHLLQIVLKEEDDNWIIFSAQNGEEALELVRTRHPHLILTDFMMPKMNGLELCRRVNEQYRIPIIVVSAISDPISISSCLVAGASAYIVKPFNVPDLISEVHRAIYSKL